MASSTKLFAFASQDLVNAAAQEIANIAKAREELEAEKAEWRKVEKKLQAVQGSDERIKLDVGGKTFSTSLSTLTTKIPDSFFGAMFSGRWQEKKEEDGCFFIDRDPSVFGLIIQFLREYPYNKLEGHLYALSKVQMAQLRDDAEFYQLFGLVDLLTAFFPTKLDLTHAHFAALSSWIPTPCTAPKLLYRHSEHGAAFHQMCDNKTPTLLLCKDNNGSIFGGFTKFAWATSNYQSYYLPNTDGSSFLFTLRNPHGIVPTKLVCAKPRNEIMISNGLGPVFGIRDLEINHVSPVYTTLGGAAYPDTTGKGQQLFTGATTGALEDWEIWQY